MCFRKEYKCYKGKDSEDCCRQRVDEAVSHRTTMIVFLWDRFPSQVQLHQ